MVFRRKTDSVSKEVTVEYVPVRKEDRLIRVPIIKKAAGADLKVVTETEKTTYREIEEDMIWESAGRREHW